VFRVSFPPPLLTIAPVGTDLLLTWPGAPGGFNLQTATDLTPLVVWVTNASVPDIFNGRYTVTNPAAGTQTFFRLESQ